jgi:exosortase/archaeosortase family protein
MAFLQIKKTYHELPYNIKVFAKRGLLILTGWLLLYYLVLKPINIPDAQLTYLTQICTQKLLSIIYSNVQLYAPDIYIGSRHVLIVTNPCNGLELFVLYIGFLACIPASWKRFLAFVFAGSAVIFVLNIMRCAGLGIMSLHNSYLTDFAHHYLFKLVIYGVAFWGWLLYSKKEKHAK